MKIRLNYLFTLCLAVGAVTLNTAVAGDAASTGGSNKAIAVAYDDLNLASTAGLDSLYQRVQFAARKVCGVENMRVSLHVMRLQRACVSWSIDKAIGNIGDSRLTALHEAKLKSMHSSSS